MIRKALSRARSAFDSRKPYLRIRHVKTGGWLASVSGIVLPPRRPIHQTVEDRAQKTNALGQRPLWAGYAGVESYPHSTTGSRASDQVRTKELTGRLFSWLAAKRDARVVVEFGTAFGVSGMYWLSGLKDGHLYTFEPNQDWAAIAAENLAAVSASFTLTTETFESAGPGLIAPGSVDIAFIDAIHTSDFVEAQCAILKPMMKPGGLILFDDINFSQDMKGCWDRIVQSQDVIAAATIEGRVGIVELPA